MSASHHSESPEERAKMELFLKQLTGDRSREWPQGRISGEDDGATAFAVATDVANRVIIIRFSKPMDWIGLGINEAMLLRNMLDLKIGELTMPAKG